MEEGNEKLTDLYSNNHFQHFFSSLLKLRLPAYAVCFWMRDRMSRATWGLAVCPLAFSRIRMTR